MSWYYPTFEAYIFAHHVKEKQIFKNLPFQHEIRLALEQVIKGQLPNGKTNLMIQEPPRFGKTIHVREFVSYGLGIFPDSQFIYTSYAASLAEEQTAAIKMTIEKEWYQKLFGIELNKASVGHWTTTEGGIVYASGLEGQLPGRGAGKKRKEFGGAIIIDDPIKTDDARSIAVKLHAREWYTGVLKSRRNSANTPIVAIGHRIAPDDLFDYILRNEGEEWHVISFPALLPDGSSLWEDTISAASLCKLREVDPFAFYAQYQQQPQVEGGNIIKADWWKYFQTKGLGIDGKEIDYIVDGLVFITADTAFKDKKCNDPTSMGVWHATSQFLDLLEEDNGLYQFPELLNRAKRLWKKYEEYGIKAFYIEDKASGASLAQCLRAQGIPAILWSPKDYGFPDDKLGRAKFSTWYIEAGRVRLPIENQMLCKNIIDECAAFSGNDDVHDDRVDMLTMAVSIWKFKGGGSDVKAS